MWPLAKAFWFFKASNQKIKQETAKHSPLTNDRFHSPRLHPGVDVIRENMKNVKPFEAGS